MDDPNYYNVIGISSLTFLTTIKKKKSVNGDMIE